MSVEPNDPTRSDSIPTDAPVGAVLSRNEVEGLCNKAARGAGMSWGHAEEAGFAAGWLAQNGIDGAAALLAHLDTHAGRDWDDICPVPAPGNWTGAGVLCPIAVGAALSDFATLPEGDLARGLTIGPISQPVLVLPFLVAMGAPVAVAWDGGRVQAGPDGVAGDTDALAATATTTLTLTRADPVRVPPRTACACTGATIATLNAYAMKTTVPPSDKSRADAGAGTSDND